MDHKKIHLKNSGEKNERDLKNKIAKKVYPFVKCILDSRTDCLLKKQYEI